MKKFALVLAFIGLFTFLTPKIATSAQPDCFTAVLVCENGSQHIVIFCDMEQWRDLYDILCGAGIN